MCARHRKIDQLACYLESPPNEFEATSKPTTCIGVPDAPDNVFIQDRDNPPTPLPNSDNYASGATAMPHVKEETDAGYQLSFRPKFGLFSASPD
ncbi:hypothetical protein PISMIDRAFT_20052 [Pisolithus microcarpus 441]|uniref:Uncharacterized protein n=1 Tax=Pisolithus microcarpus 441 TaxID=765257 RepID=A0A0C9YKE1_9AGAM|nr:hypothetical protein PISMIDRAFT_20052 [Pisolithus microcarpus 441]